MLSGGLRYPVYHFDPPLKTFPKSCLLRLTNKCRQPLRNLLPSLHAVHHILNSLNDPVLRSPDLRRRVPVPQCYRPILHGVKVDRDTEGRAQFVIPGISLANRGTRRVRNVGNPQRTKAGGEGDDENLVGGYTKGKRQDLIKTSVKKCQWMMIPSTYCADLITRPMPIRLFQDTIEDSPNAKRRLNNVGGVHPCVLDAGNFGDGQEFLRQLHRCPSITKRRSVDRHNTLLRNL